MTLSERGQGGVRPTIRRAPVRTSRTNVRRLRALAVEQAAHERRADDHAVGARRHLDGLRGVGDAHADEHRLVGDRLEPPGDHQRRSRPASSRSPVTPSRPTA